MDADQKAQQLLVELRNASTEMTAEFAYCSLLLFVPHICCGLHISSLLPSTGALQSIRGLLALDYVPLAIMGIPNWKTLSGGKHGQIIKQFLQEDWVAMYVETAILGEEQLLRETDPRLT